MRPRASVAAAVVSLLVCLSLVLFTTPCSAYHDLEYYITDDAYVLLWEEMLDIEDVCIEVYEATGAQMAVLIVNTTQPYGIDDYARGTFEETELGIEGRDDGLLLLISVSEDLWRIEVGYGLEGILPDLKVNQIAQDHLVPFLEVGDYYQGVLYCMAFLGEQILDNYEGEPPDPPAEPWYPIPFLPLLWWQLLIAIAVFLAISALTGGGGLWIGGLFRGGGIRGGGGGGRSGGGGAKGRF